MSEYLSFSVSIAVISWIFGMVCTSLLIKARHDHHFSNILLTQSNRVDKLLGLRYFKWIVRKTFFKYLNPDLKLSSKIDLALLLDLRKRMVTAELHHLFAFGFVCVFAVFQLLKSQYAFFTVMMLVNVFLNLYPSLLQQQNKKRIDKLIKKYGSRSQEGDRLA